MKNDYRLKSVMYIFASFLILIFCACSSSGPPVAKIEPVVDTLHGVEIVDNYRWLEDGENQEVRIWEDQQDAYCRKLLGQYPDRPALKNRIVFDHVFELIHAFARGP